MALSQSFAFVVVLIFAIQSGCLAAKFAMISMKGRSHYLVLERLGKELESRGHEMATGAWGKTLPLQYDNVAKFSRKRPPELTFCVVANGKVRLWWLKYGEERSVVRHYYSVSDAQTMICVTLSVVIFVGECETYALKDSNIRTFKCPEEINIVDPTSIAGLMVIWYHYCDALLGHRENMNEAKSADLIIGDAMYLCSFLIADKFSLPHVTVLMSPQSSALGLPYNFANLPSYIPQMFSRSTDDMNFLQRAENSLRWLLGRMAFPNMLHSVYAGLKEKYNITPEKSLQETFQKVDIVLVQSDPLDYPRPHLPNTKLVGPFLSSPAKPLSEEFEQFVRGSGDEGVVLVSFGSILGDISDQTASVMADVFSTLPQRVIWKLNTEGRRLTLGENIKVSSWLPQNDILGHPKTRLFIGHAGMNGLLQAGYHGVPMICVPFFGDQFDNSIAAKYFGMAEILHKESITKESLLTAINTVINNASYRESAARISKSIKLRPRTSIQESADWVEYTQAQGGLPHLRPKSLDLPFYQLYLLDVLFVFVLLLIVVFVAVSSVIRCFYRLCFKPKPNKEKPH